MYFIKGEINGKEFQAGHFKEMPIFKLRQLTNNAQTDAKNGKLNVLEGNGTRSDSWFHKCVDVAALQANNSGALFQVASNFNGLETTFHNQDISEQDLERYAYDFTQGPAASISAAPGLILRRYYPFYVEGTNPSDWEQTPTGPHKINF